MDETLSELRALAAGAGIRRKAIAARMKLLHGTLSRYLSGSRPIPADFEARFRAAVADLAREQAQAERDAAEQRAQALLRRAGVIEEVAA